MSEELLFKRLFSPIMILLIAYEWIISGLNKIFSEDFVQQLHKQLVSALDGLHYPFYGVFLKHYVIPFSKTFAVLVEVGELVVGMSFIILAVALFRNKLTKAMSMLGIATGLLSAFIVLNFFFFQGGTVFVDPENRFDEGISIDLILFLMQAWITIFFLTLNYKHSKRRNCQNNL